MFFLVLFCFNSHWEHVTLNTALCGHVRLYNDYQWRRSGKMSNSQKCQFWTSVQKNLRSFHCAFVDKMSNEIIVRSHQTHLTAAAASCSSHRINTCLKTDSFFRHIYSFQLKLSDCIGRSSHGAISREIFFECSDILFKEMTFWGG